MNLLLVGTHFHKPGKVLLRALRSGSELELVREPENPYDANAILVLCGTDQLDKEELKELEGELEAFGNTLEEIYSQANWPIGHIGASGGKPIEKALRAGIDVSGGLELLNRVAEPELPIGLLRFEGEFVLVEVEL